MLIDIKDAVLYAAIITNGTEVYTNQAGTIAVYKYNDTFYTIYCNDSVVTIELGNNIKGGE